MKLAVIGASGRLGRRVVALALEGGVELVAAVTRRGSGALGHDAGVLAGVASCGLPLSAPGPGCFADADVVIDVSLPGGMVEAGAWLGAAALVCGVTGQDEAGLAALHARADVAPVLVASNFSTGVALLVHLVGQAARALPGYDIEIIEAHHRRKKDAPSGTALALGQSAARARGQTLEGATFGRHGLSGERDHGIGFHALRGGDIIGEHQVWLCGDGERLMLGHVATSRDTFAHGALGAARWLVGRPPGMYGMADVLGLQASP